MPVGEAPQEAFWSALSSHCGNAYAGELVSEDARDEAFRGQPMIAHWAQCREDRIAIAFHIFDGDAHGGWNRSRTWLVTREGSGEAMRLTLKHDHRHADGEPDAVTFYGGTTDAPGTANAQDFPVDAESIALFGREGLDASLTFAAFVTGDANVLARNAAQRMAANEKPQFSPLYIKAATGQGKTHLLHAIGHQFLAQHPRARIFYCSAERFMIEFVQALKQNRMIEFKTRLRGFDLLLVDDLQFIIGKASAQEELLYTIDHLLAEGKRLVFAADRAPQALDSVEPRLLSRLSMGLVADIQSADLELRRSILESKLTRFAPLSVPDDVIDFLARTITRNVRELVGGLNKLIAYAQLTGQPVSLQLAEEQLTDILSANRRRITIDEIQRTVCQFYRIDRSEMSSKRRTRAVVRPRQVAMYLSKVLTPRSYPEIGRKFGGRDHSTVIHAVKLIEDLRTRDADMDGDVRSLLRQLES